MNNVLTYVKKHPSTALALLAFGLFSLSTAGTEINKLDVRFALLVQDLKNSSIGVFPKLNGVNYPDYFVPCFLLSYLTTLGGRFVTLWTLALPTMVMGSFAVGMVCRIGERLQKGIGIAGALLLLATSEAVFYMCSFSMDVFVAAAGCLMLLAFQKDPVLWKKLLIFAGLLAFCTFIRGSLGLIVFGVAAGGYLMGGRKWKELLLFGVTGAVTGALCVGTILYIVYLQGGAEELRQLAAWQIHNRVGGGDYLFYFLDGFASFGPLSFVAAFGILAGRKKMLQKPWCSFLGWVLFPLLLLSVPGGKHLRYLEALLPPLALIGGWGIVNCPAPIRVRALRIGRALFPWLPVLGLAASLGLAVGLSLFACFAEVPLFALCCAGVFYLLLFLYRKRFMTSDGGVFIHFALCIAAAVLLLAIPLTGMRESSKVFVQTVESGRKGSLCFFNMGPDYDDLKYILCVPVSKRGEIRYLKTGLPSAGSYKARMYRHLPFPEALSQITAGDRLIFRGRNSLKALQEAAEKSGRKVEIIAAGDLGHHDCLAARIVPCQ